MSSAPLPPNGFTLRQDQEAGEHSTGSIQQGLTEGFNSSCTVPISMVVKSNSSYHVCE